jgi:hypothetical protein
MFLFSLMLTIAEPGIARAALEWRAVFGAAIVQ